MKKILILSDLHVGSLYGLWPPGFETIDSRNGDIVKFLINPTQKHLWKHWKDRLLKEVPDPDCIIINGDVNHGLAIRDKGRGLVTPNLTWQKDAAVFLLKTLPDVPTYMTEGTEYHEFADGRSIEETIAAEIGATYGDELIIEECGIRLFCRHFVSSSQSTWQYESTAPGRDHMLLYLNKAEDKYGPLDVAVFSHRHRFVHPEFLSGSAIVTPCWQTKDHYSVKKGITSLPDIGWVTLEIKNRKCIAVDKSGIITPPTRPCQIVGRDVKRRK